MWGIEYENNAHLLLGFVSHVRGLFDKLMLFIAIVRVAPTLPDMILNHAHITAGQLHVGPTS